MIYSDDIHFKLQLVIHRDLRAIAEINSGRFGDGVELVRDRNLSWNSDRVYRFINLNAKTKHRLNHQVARHHVRNRGDDSPFP